MKHLVVIDTNVVLSALQSKNGKSFGLISKMGSGLFNFAISVPLILEYEEILKNHLDRNIFSESDIEDFIDYICSVGIRTKIFYLWRPYLRDPVDDHVLELAINAGINFNIKRTKNYNKNRYFFTKKKQTGYFFRCCYLACFFSVLSCKIT